MRAKAAVDKAHNFQRRERMFIHKATVEQMVVWTEERDVELRRFAVLFLLAYSFLLRVPSAALPAVVGCCDGVQTSNAALVASGETLTLHLNRRKNKPTGSCLVRRCCCATSPNMCIVCLLRPLMLATPPGKRIFEGITAGGAVWALRHLLEAVGIEGAQAFRPHDLRRGHAEDLRLGGAFVTVGLG